MTDKLRVRHILIAEDDDLIRTVTEETLREAGYGVVSVPDGADAWAALSQIQPDLIVSDVRMPRCDGFELLQRVRRHPEYSQIPFIILSAKADTADQRMGMSLGADDYVTKPYQPADLLKTIAVRLERSTVINQILYHQQRFLTSVLPHELRTPLTGIIGYADLLVQSAEMHETISHEDLIDYGKNIMRSGQRLLRVAEDFSLWSWLEGKQEALRAGGKVERDLQAVDQALLEALARECADDHGRLDDLRVNVATAKIEVAPEGFNRTFRHLVENAFKFSLPGAVVEVTGRANEQFFEITVSDHGRGMTEDHIRQVAAMRQFGRERFEQQGLGMGLIIARIFARASGGELDLEAQNPGPGLVARLVLPLISPS